MPELKASASEGSLKNSPYQVAVGKRPKKQMGWQPPAGSFNQPELPSFSNPGPGRYSPVEQHAVLSTKPRVVAARFGSEDRFKYLSPLSSLSRTSSGVLGGLAKPQESFSPGPGYKPSYNLVRSASQASSFTVERRDMMNIESSMRGAAPGPGLYTPSDTTTSKFPNKVAGGGFLTNDRHKYLGELDAASLTPALKHSPGPMYRPDPTPIQRRASTTRFGGHGPNTMKAPPSMAQHYPGPGAYEVVPNNLLSSKRNSQSTFFASEPRLGTKSIVDSTMSFHGKVPIDMQNADVTKISPGPAYKPEYGGIRPRSQQAVIGKDRRLARSSTKLVKSSTGLLPA